jgi:hypothetical protein
LAAAVEAMSKSASLDRLDCTAARAAANIRPYVRAVSASKGNGSHVVLAHCSRSWRRARSSLSSVACGPAASSAIDALIDHSIEIRTKSAGIDPRRAHCSFSKGCPRHEPSGPKGPQLGDWCAVAGYHDRSPGLHLAKHGRGLIAKLPLRDYSVHASLKHMYHNVANSAVAP